MSLAFVFDHRADVDPDGDVISDGSQSLADDALLRRVIPRLLRHAPLLTPSQKAIGGNQ